MNTETEHLLTVLKTTILFLGSSTRKVEKKLGVGSSYLSRLFSGRMELKFQHIVDIARAVGMEPEEMLFLAYPSLRQPPTEAATRLRSLIGLPQAGRPGPAPGSRAGRPRGDHDQGPAEALRRPHPARHLTLTAASDRSVRADRSPPAVRRRPPPRPG